MGGVYAALESLIKTLRGLNHNCKLQGGSIGGAEMKIASVLLLSVIATWASIFGATTVYAETVFKVWHHGSQVLLKAINRVDGLDVSLTISKPTQIFIHGHVDVIHRCIDLPGYGNNYAIGIGMRLEHLDQTGVSRWIQGSKWGPNIANCLHHYVSIPLDGYLCLSATGTHKITVWASGHTTATDNTTFNTNSDGVAAISPASDSNQPGGTNDPYNEMIVRVVSTESCPK